MQECIRVSTQTCGMGTYFLTIHFAPNISFPRYRIPVFHASVRVNREKVFPFDLNREKERFPKFRSF